MPEPTAPLVDIAQEPVRTKRPPWLIVIGAVVVAALLILFKLASEIRAGETLSFDESLIMALRVPGQPAVPAGPPWLAPAMRDMTALGGGLVLTIVVILTAIFLILKRRWNTAVLVVLATLSGGLAIAAAKDFFARARPDVVDHLVEVTSMSFPSGHAGNSAIVYLTLATLLFPVIKEARLRVFVLVAALLLVVVIGVSRVYLGVHWPSDVLAGWLFGALWALGWWGVETKLLARPVSR